jgi:hypothetical protein
MIIEKIIFWAITGYRAKHRAKNSQKSFVSLRFLVILSRQVCFYPYRKIHKKILSANEKKL